MKCAQCGADNRSGAKFCEQCGTKLPAVDAAASVSAAPAVAHESLLDEVVESMAKEPGTTKGPGFRLALIFLLLILVAGVLWAYLENASTSRLGAISLPQGTSDAPMEGALRAPSLAEQMGGGAAAPATNMLDGKPEQPAPGKVSPEPKRTKEVKAKAQREDGQRRKNEDAGRERQAQEERDLAARKAAAANRAWSTAQEVANCEKMSVFARQPCLWRACNGKWGQDGCPSYD